MALINCRECGKQISDEAINCVHCGCPIIKKKAKIIFVREKILEMSNVNINLYYDNDIFIGTLKNDASLVCDIPLGEHKLIVELTASIEIHNILINGNIEAKKERKIENITIDSEEQIFYFTPNPTDKTFTLSKKNDTKQETIINQENNIEENNNIEQENTISHQRKNVCIKCGNELNEQAHFCSSCGTPIGTPIKEEQKICCSKCGKEANDKTTNCIYCGNPINRPTKKVIIKADKKDFSFNTYFLGFVEQNVYIDETFIGKLTKKSLSYETDTPIGTHNIVIEYQKATIPFVGTISFCLLFIMILPIILIPLFIVLSIVNKYKPDKKIKEFSISNDKDITNVLITKQLEIEITQTNNNQSI